MAYGNLKVDSLIYDNSGSDVTVSVSALAGAGSAAGINSPTFTGIPAAPTASSGTNTTQIATTAFVTTGLATKLPLAGGTLTGGLTGTSATFAGTITAQTDANTKTSIYKDGAIEAFNGGSQKWYLASNGSATFAAANNEIDATGQLTIKKAAPYTDPSFRILDRNNSNASGVLMYGNGSATFSGAVTADSYKTPAQAVSALAINLSTGNYFTKTIAGNSTFTFTNPPASGTVGSFTLELTHSSGTVAWPATVKWPADTAPTLTAGKTHLFIFVTDDGGTRYRGAALADYVN